MSRVIRAGDTPATRRHAHRRSAAEALRLLAGRPALAGGHFDPEARDLVALAAAAALAGEGGAALVPAETARVYLHAEAGDSTAAFASLAALEALAPESVEAEMARAFLGGDAPAAGRGTDGASTSGKAGSAEAAGALTLAVAPNPAGASATLTLTLAEAADVTVAVYDLLGRVVQMSPVAAMPAGAHRVALDAARWAPGVYVVRAVVNTAAGAVVRTARLTVAR